MEFFLNGTEPTDVAPLEGEIDEKAFLMDRDPTAEVEDAKGDDLSPLSARAADSLSVDLTPISARKGKTNGTPPTRALPTQTSPMTNKPKQDAKPNDDHELTDDDDDEDRPQ